MRQLLTFTVCFLILFSESIAKSVFPEQAYQKILSLDLDTSISHPQNASSALESLVHDKLDMLFALVKDEDIIYDKLSLRQDLRLKQLKEFNDPDSIQAYVKSELHLHWALIFWRRGDNISAGWQLRKGYKGLLQLKESHPNYADVQKSLGLLHIMMSAIPSEYQWLIQIFGFENNLTKGLKELEFASKNGEYFSQESALLLAYVEGFMLNYTTQGLKRIEKISSQSKSKLVDVVLIIYCNKIGKNEIALQKLSTLQKHNFNAAIVPILKLLSGELYLKKGLYSEAAFYLKSFDVLYQGKAFQKEVRLKLFYALLLSGDEKAARDLMNKPINKGSEVAASDRYASVVLNEGRWPNKILLKSRLLYDGGYINAAEDEIKQFPLLSTITKSDNTEYYYRYGRIFQAKNDFSQAISFFKRCVEIQGDLEFYFAPNACLQIGLIKKELGQFESARGWLDKAMSYKKNPYQRTIENQAKAALNAM